VNCPISTSWIPCRKRRSYHSIWSSSIHVVESTEATILAAESDNPAKQITVSGLSTQIQFTAYNQDIDNSLIENMIWWLEICSWWGTECQRHDGCSHTNKSWKEVNWQRIWRCQRLTICSEIKSTVGRMDYMSPNYTIICARHTWLATYKSLSRTGTFDTVERATQTIMDAQCFVSKLKTKDGNTIPYISNGCIELCIWIFNSR
jgi:hypothetical protein